MALSQALLPEFDYEMANTRKTLARVPEDKFEWRPHEKSMTMAGLATHLSSLPSWVVRGLTLTELDIAPGGVPLRAEPVKSVAEALENFDRNVADARAALAGATDEQLQQSWSLLSNGRTVMTIPRYSVVRSFVLNHLIHHRAQLGVYLRLNDVPVPSLYGPSADEGSL